MTAGRDRQRSGNPKDKGHNVRTKQIHFGLSGRFLLCAAAIVAMAVQCSAQPVIMPGRGGIQFSGDPAQMQAAMEAAKQAQAQAESGEKPIDESKNESGEGEEKKEGEEGNEEKKEGDGNTSSETVKRPTEPPKVADPRELDAKPDKNDKIQFSFNGQAWPDVLQWLANVSDYSFDWTELPGGYLNLSTQRPYTLAEARNLINRQLHARGYTMILTGEVLSVFKIDKLDPALIPRVTEEDLYDLQPQDFVKITFQLPADMEVAKAAEDVQKMVSEHAKVIALPSTKRLLLISTVANGRLVSMIFNEERLVADGKVVPVEIVLKHRRAEKIIDILYVVLGLDPASQPSQAELAVQQQKMQLLMQMQGAGADVATMLKKDGPPVYIAYNSQRNSIMVNAPNAELKVIQRTVEMLDVPSNHASASDIAENPGRRLPKSYKLESIDPRTLLTTLEEIGDLSPLAELRADNKADILFARATQRDHEKITQMIEELDGAEQETRVFDLRKHPADAVAGTLRGLFAEKKEDDSNSRRNRYYGFYGYGRNDEEEEKPTDLKIDADVGNNRLIVRGSPEQLDQVEDFLVKIGEPRQGAANADRLRMVDSIDPAATAKLIEQLRRTWPTIGENELVIQAPDALPMEEPPVEQSSETSDEPPAEVDRATHLRPRRSQPEGEAVFRLVADSQDPQTGGSEPGGEEAKKPPIVIKITPDGRLMLSSEDTAALDKLEEIIEASAPPQQRFKIIEVNYVTAFSIYLTLKGFYADELKGEETEGYFDYRYYEYVPGKSAGSPQMSKRKKLQLDYDVASNTILVANASPSQLREIESLISSYDQPTAGDSAKSRRTAAIKIKYNRAKIVAAALKEVYRDLLSQRDKEFETDDKNGAGTAKETTTIIRYGNGSGGDSDGTKKPTPVKVGFQGALSVGVDEISNTIIISVQEELFESVLMIIEGLDEAAKPQTTVAVHSVGKGMNAEALQKALSEALGRPWIGGKPEQQGEQKSEGENKNGENGKKGEGPGGPGGRGNNQPPGDG